MKRILQVLAALTLLCLSSSCEKDEHRPVYDDTMILVSAGFNNISSSLTRDIRTLAGGYVPSKKDKDLMFVISHSCRNGNYSWDVPTSPVIVRLYRITENKESVVVRDTLQILPEGSLLTDPAVLSQALKYIDRNFKSKSYGLVYSSHGTGWLPSGYYNDPGKFDPDYDAPTPQSVFFGKKRAAHSPTVDRSGLPVGVAPYFEPDLPGPQTKSLGSEQFYMGDELMARETELGELSSSLPMKFEYILMDACLMGCVEVAWALRDKCDYVGFSAAEILTSGLYYEEMGSALLENSPDPERVCKDFYTYYENQTGDQKSATIALVKTAHLPQLADLCKTLINKYRDQIMALSRSQVQGFFRSGRHFFFDLEDIFVKAGISEEEKSELERALGKAVIYKSSTESFMPYSGGFKIEAFCGMTMYLPSEGTPYLDNFYKTLDWNTATSLVR